MKRLTAGQAVCVCSCGVAERWPVPCCLSEQIAECWPARLLGSQALPPLALSSVTTPSVAFSPASEPCATACSPQRTVKLFNRSDVKVSFKWKQHATSDDDAHVRLQKSMMLSQARATKKIVRPQACPTSARPSCPAFVRPCARESGVGGRGRGRGRE
eukprot:3709019-Pleurochrysis_carterae.AAC.3